MKEDIRRECTPQDYILNLFEDTKDEKLTIQYFPFLGEPYSLKYRMNWTKQDAEALVEKYNSLTSALIKIGKHHEELENQDKRTELLSPEELKVFDIYIKPFPPFEVSLSEVGELYFRSETDSLSDEENELLERHHDWFVENSRKRLPFDKWCPSRLINRAQRYEKLVSMNAPQIVVTEEGRFLAEEMVLYYHCKKQLAFDSLKFIMAQNKTYELALQEIKNGRKETHWMWFVFPQLRGLGSSEMSNTYGIADLDEANAYLADEVLGARLFEISSELLKLNTSDARAIFGDIDAKKLQSSMTLFALISEKNSVFKQVLEKYFDGQSDFKTIELLNSNYQ